MTERSKIFIAYCFPEKRWLDRVQAALEPFAGLERCIIWDERKLRAGAWKEELPDVLATTKVAMMIVSDLFLESDFVTRVKLPAMLERERESGLEICWVLASHCLFELAGLKDSDAGNRVGAAFDGIGLAQRDAEVAAIARKVAAYLGVDATKASAELAPKKPLLPSAIPQVLTPKPVPKKLKSLALRREEIANPPQPPPQEPAPAEAPGDASIAQTSAASSPIPEETGRVETAAPMSMRALSLETMIQARQVTVLKLSRLARLLLFASGAIVLGSIPLIFVESLTHFLIVAGFGAFVASLAVRLQARTRYLGQGLVGMRYTGSGLADDALPTRQREMVVRRADEYLAQN